MLIGQASLTPGNLKHSHIYLRAFFDRFPPDTVGGSNKAETAPRLLLIDWGGPALIETDLCGEKRIFRARRWIREFFAANDAAPGDEVVIEETSAYAYRIRLNKASRVAP